MSDRLQQDGVGGVIALFSAFIIQTVAVGAAVQEKGASSAAADWYWYGTLATALAIASFCVSTRTAYFKLVHYNLKFYTQAKWQYQPATRWFAAWSALWVVCLGSAVSSQVEAGDFVNQAKPTTPKIHTFISAKTGLPSSTGFETSTDSFRVTREQTLSVIKVVQKGEFSRKYKLNHVVAYSREPDGWRRYLPDPYVDAPSVIGDEMIDRLEMYKLKHGTEFKVDLYYIMKNPVLLDPSQEEAAWIRFRDDASKGLSIDLPENFSR